MKEEKELIIENEGLVYKLAHKYSKQYRIELNDLIQEGSIGLIKASRNFKKDKGILFSTYAYRLIEGEILHYILQDRHRFNRTMKNGIYTTKEIRHLEFDTTFRGATYSLKDNYLLMDLERILKDKEFYIIKKYYFERYTFKEISKTLHCSGSWVVGLKNGALSKIKDQLGLEL